MFTTDSWKAVLEPTMATMDVLTHWGNTLVLQLELEKYEIFLYRFPLISFL